MHWYKSFFFKTYKIYSFFYLIFNYYKLILDVDGGGYYCHCRDGFKPDPTNPLDCIDIDECQGNNTCTQTCLNTKGSYLCRCLEDYENNVVVGAMTGKDCRAKVSFFFFLI